MASFQRPLKFYIDTQKGLTAVFILLLMAVYHQWQNPTAWIYLALHGVYGLLWVLKSHIFPDRSWEEPTSLWFGLVSWGSLCLYWVAPWLITSRGVQAPAWYLALCISLYIFGVFLHFTADMQKYMALHLNPDHLVTDGFFSRLRNPNYFGELLIYGSFAMLAMHWLPFVILMAWVILYWVPRMLQKDRRLARYSTFLAYKAHSKWFIPFLF